MYLRFTNNYRFSRLTVCHLSCFQNQTRVAGPLKPQDTFSLVDLVNYFLVLPTCVNCFDVQISDSELKKLPKP
jgi:hypothetical protein